MSISAELRHSLASSWRYGHGFDNGRGFLCLSLDIFVLYPSSIAFYPCLTFRQAHMVR
jgi:hypothetical protein